MNATVHRIFAWTGVAYITLFVIAIWFVAGFLPPIPPSWSSAQIAALYTDHSLEIRAATAIMMLGTMFGFSWTASVAAWTARLEGGFPVLSFTQLCCGVWSFGGAYNIIVAWSSAAFRPDRPEQIVYLLSDQGWYWTVMIGSCAVMQCAAIGIAVLSDKAADPMFPRWVGYFNIWMGVLQIPGVTLPFFKTGPFAWNGLFTFWMPLIVFSLWIYVTTWAVLRAIKRQEAAQA